MEAQSELTKFFKPITETQKATAKEITEELKPIKERIENLPNVITFPAFPSVVASELGPQAVSALKQFLSKEGADRTFGLYDDGGKFYIGDKQVVIKDNNIIVDNEEYKGTPGLWELIVAKKPDKQIYNPIDHENYKKLMINTNSIYRNNDPNNKYPKGNKKGYKWNNVIKPIWDRRKEYQGRGGIVIPSDPNALLERLDLLLSSQEAGHTGVGNELVSICDELKRQEVIDTDTYKKLNSIIKMIITRHGFKKRYAYGGSGIFDSITNLLMRIFTSGAAKQLATSAIDVGKSVAKEGAKKALEAGKSAATDVGKKLVQKALTPKSKKILQKYTTQPTTQNINALIDGSAVEIQNLVKRLNTGMGIKKIFFFLI